MTPAATCRRNGWTVGTVLAGDEGYGETIIQITAVGAHKVLAVTLSHAGIAYSPSEHNELSWTFDCRTWRVVTP